MVERIKEIMQQLPAEIKAPKKPSYRGRSRGNPDDVAAYEKALERYGLDREELLYQFRINDKRRRELEKEAFEIIGSSKELKQVPKRYRGNLIERVRFRFYMTDWGWYTLVHAAEEIIELSKLFKPKQD